MSATLIGVLLFGYLLGTIPFGIFWAKIWDLGDLRKTGSGNIGATNVLRTGSKKAAALTLVCDMLKGAIPVLVATQIYGEYAGLIAGLGAFLGHLYPVWLNFRGGKGVATYLGVMLAVNFGVGLIACATWLATAALGRISSLAALIAVLAGIPAMYWLDSRSAVYLAITLGALVWARHAANIFRLLRGTEPKIGRS